MWEWAGLAFWFREEELQVENTEKIMLAESEERQEWKPTVPGSQRWHNRHRPSACTGAPAIRLGHTSLVEVCLGPWARG